jgi:hypothetical protein
MDIQELRDFLKNQLAFPPEELVKYDSQYVAWSPDGSRIIAHDKNPLKLDETVKALGYDPAGILISSVRDQGRTFIGGGSLLRDLQELDTNRGDFPPEELLQYRGKDIAWSPDGTRVIASDDDLLKLMATVKELGYDLSEVVFSSVPEGDSLIA